MIIKVKATPSNEEILEILKREFSDDYAYKLYGLGKKSIMVRKSALIGAQISVRENEISIEGTPPSFGAGFLATLAMSEAAVMLVPIFALAGAFPSRYKKLERKLALFLREKYG